MYNIRIFGGIEGMVSRFARIWAQISTGHNSKMLKARPNDLSIWYFFPTKSGTGYRLE